MVPGIIPVDVYAPGDVTRLYAELQAGAPGRFIAGLGGPQVPRPLRPLHDYLDRLDQGEPPVPSSRRILAALGPRKLEIARERAAGAVLLLVTPDYTRTARRILGTAATLVISQMVVLQADAARAREAARGPLRFLSGVAGYRASFTRMGFTGSDIDGLSDELVDELVAWELRRHHGAGQRAPASRSRPRSTHRAGQRPPRRHDSARPLARTLLT